MALNESNESENYTSDDVSDGSEKGDISLEYFVDLLERHGSSLRFKGRTPAAVKEKQAALDAMCGEIQNVEGIEFSAKQVSTKFNNLKTRIKKKADITRTGNKRIILTKAEGRFWEFVLGEENPALTKVPCMIDPLFDHLFFSIVFSSYLT